MFKRRTMFSLILVVALCTTAHAQDEEDLRLPISLDAESTNYDGKSSMLMFSGLRLTQGRIAVEADEGRASNLDFADSVWEFSGNVVIDLPMGRIECESAHLQFSDHQLQHATITGSPATFEMQRQNSDVVTYAEAGRLEYDFSAGIIEFSEQATITEGGNQISSNYLVYNIEEQRINARSAGEGEPRVKITYTPGNGSAGNGEPAEDDEQREDDEQSANQDGPDEARGGDGDDGQ